MYIFRKIYLLLWKNLLFRRRHYIVTGCETILPVFLFIQLTNFAYYKDPDAKLVYGNGSVNPKYTGARESDLSQYSETIHQARLENELLSDAQRKLLDHGSSILFAPNTTLAQEIINRVMTNLSSDSSGAEGFASEAMINQHIKESSKTVAEKYPNSWQDRYKYKAVVIFDGSFNWNPNNPPPANTVVSYKIRIIGFRKSSDRSSVSENELFTYPLHPGAGLKQDSYANSGFSGLQIALDKAIIWFLANKMEPMQQIHTQAMPYPAYTVDWNSVTGDNSELDRYDVDGAYNDSFLLSLVTVLGFVFIVPSVIRNVVSEKETGIKELMKIMGLPNWMHWLGWMLNSLILLPITIAFATLFVFLPVNKVNGGYLVNADFTLWFVVLLLFVTATVAFCFLVSTFFQRPALALTFGILLYLTTFFAVIFPMDVEYKFFRLHHKLALSIMPNVALHLAIKSIFYKEMLGGQRWSNMFKRVSSTDDLVLGFVCIMLIFDTVLFIALTIYFENIIPSEYGLRKPWYYPFQCFNCRRKSAGRVTPDTEEQGTEDRPGFEPEPTDLHAGVVIRNLRKEFGRNKVAVNMVGTLKMYDGQITALLGHNGAGKTTTLSILTGLFAPTSGTATVNGYDIRNNMDEVRQNLGLCPQHNMLFSKLTVEEHLKFFGMLKGLTKRQATEQSQYLSWRMHLLDKINVQAGALSGGQKRKLSLGMALIGGTKVVVLDEPTSGMDPEARRAIWDLLLGMRGERTIILTTHFMEEADVLGDRIAIMADGQVKCCGTPAFLRKYYGTGYTLKLTVADPSVRPNILVLVQKHFPEASFKTSHGGNTAEVDITIPTEQNTNSAFPGFFSGLAGEQQQLGVQTVGLSLATMDDIFVKVGEEVGIGEDEFATNEVVVRENNEANGGPRLVGCSLVFQQFYGVFLKRLLSTWRKRKLFLTQFFVPVVLLIISILFSNVLLSSDKEDVKEWVPLKMNLLDYKSPVTLYRASSSDLNTSYAMTVGKSGRPVTTDVELELLSEGKNNLSAYRNQYIVAGELNDTNATAFYSALPNHASPLSVNLMSNAILRSMTPTIMNYKIDVATQPIYFTIKTLVDRRVFQSISTFAANLFGPLMTIGLALLVASYVVSPVEERQCNVKQLQFMTGVNPTVYWTASFVWDYCSVFILVCIMLLCFPIFDRYGVYMANHGAGVLFLILITYGFAGISFSYLCSTFLKTVPAAFSFLSMIHILSGILVALIYFNLRDETAAYAYFFFRMFPTFGAALAIMRFTEISVRNVHCGTMEKAMLTEICRSHSRSSSNSTNSPRYEVEHCCDNCKPFLPSYGEEIMCSPESSLRWSTRFQSIRRYAASESVTIYVPGIGQEVLYMLITGLLYQALFMLIEFGLFKWCFAQSVKVDPAIFAEAASADPDVRLEKERVTQLVSTGLVAQDALVVDNFCKRYGGFAAVSGLSFGVHYGECFGLLGVNGAGKTTTFRMLTGDEIRSFGNAYNMGLSLDENRAEFLSRIGYCPQFDGIVGVLTGKEMVDLFARLRGIPRVNVDEESNKWLFKVGLLESANVQCQKYSGGMKRRLCAAIALVGDSPVVLLDEPTSGVDPIARRQFWKVLDSVRKSGQAVVLTSHSMEECEALCSRLGIMVNGQFQCLGGVQHLKAKFAQGFKLVVTLNKAFPEQPVHTQTPPPLMQNTKEQAREDEEQELEPSTEPHVIEPHGQPTAPDPQVPELPRQVTDEERVNLLGDEILKTYNPCFLRERHQRMLEFQVIGVEFRWGQMFEMMEGIRAKFEDLIEDYSITETTLEEVFLSLARMQYPEREVAASCLKKCFNC